MLRQHAETQDATAGFPSYPARGQTSGDEALGTRRLRHLRVLVRVFLHLTGNRRFEVLHMPL